MGGGSSGGSSSSSSSQATTSTTTNQQVAADNSGVAVGVGGTYVNEFSPAVANTISQVIDSVFSFANNNSGGAASLVTSAINSNQNIALDSIDSSKQIGQGALSLAGSAISAIANSSTQSATLAAGAVNAANAAASEAINNAQLGQTSILTNPAVIAGIVVVIGIIGFLAFKRK